MTDHKDRLEHTIEVLVYAPLGAGLYIKDMGPTFVNMFVARGRAEIDRRQAQVQQRTTTAKSVGQVAVAFGVPMVRQRVEREVGSARQRAQTFLGTIGGTEDTNGFPAPAPEPAATAAAPAATTVVDPGSPDPEVKTPPTVANGIVTNATETNGSQADDALPIPGYNSLSASQVVQRLAGLSADELGAVREYESSNRKRRTILGKIDQISA